MIFTAIIALGYMLISSVLSLLPSSSGFPPEVLESAMYIGGQAAKLNLFMPLATMATCLSIVFSVEIGLFGFKTVRWIIAHLPYVGGRG